MLYAKVVFGLPVEGPFDYSVPEELARGIAVGVRVRVSFGARILVGYVVGLAKKSAVANLKPLSEIIDPYPILNRQLLELTRQVSRHYGCSWGEALETAIPEPLRRGVRLKPFPRYKTPVGRLKQPVYRSAASVTLVQDVDFNRRWDYYREEIKRTVTDQRSVLVITPDTASATQALQRLSGQVDCQPEALVRRKAGDAGQWIALSGEQVRVIIAARSGIFVPLVNLGLIILDQEESESYKQEQVPHYHAREVALLRSRIGRIRLILGSSAPSLEMYLAAKKGTIGLKDNPSAKASPEVRILDTYSAFPLLSQKKGYFARYLIDSIAGEIDKKGKVLIYVNRMGFATFSFCRQCGFTMRCPRCDINLVYHFSDKLLRCRYCNYQSTAPNICPQCRSGYLTFSGAGTEKVESELARLFPQAKILRVDARTKASLADADICIATSAIIKYHSQLFSLVVALSVDNTLNRVDFRAAEKAFQQMWSLRQAAGNRMLIQTRLSKHHLFKALQKNDYRLFYDEELLQRKQLQFPPFAHLAMVKLRAVDAEKVKVTAERLFERLSSREDKPGISVISVNPGQPAKLRGKHYWNILCQSRSREKLARFLKINLQAFPHSGIIITVDVDPL